MNNQLVPNVRKKVYLPKRILETKRLNRILNRKERRKDKGVIRELVNLIDNYL
jgi:hypothetical protein